MRWLRGDSEARLIDAFLRVLPHRDAPFGPGDDCGFLRVGANATGPKREHGVWMTTDAVVEGVHFSFPFFTLADVGHKALAVNLSDLAAMGARPTGWLCSLGLPEGFTAAQMRQLANGMRPLAVEHGLTLIGGNLTRAPGLSVTLTMIGEGGGLLRSGAKVGDRLVVSGAFGGAAAGLEIWRRDGSGGAALFRRQKRPTPRVLTGMTAVGLASAAIDVSDAFLLDLSRLCAASDVGAEVRFYPPSDPASRSFSPPERIRLALTGGEDYELLFAVPKKNLSFFLHAHAGVPLSVVGEVVEKRRGVRVNGKVWSGPGGHLHL